MSDCIYYDKEPKEAPYCNKRNTYLDNGCGECKPVTYADVVERSEYERKADYERSLEAHFADWAPVVRCQDCAFWGCVKKGRCELTRYPTRPHDYCSYGERKSEK